MTACVLDIPPLESPEQRLRLSQFSVEHAADAIFWVARDARIVYANEQAVRSLGYSRAELLSMRVPDIDPVYPQEGWNDTWRVLREQGFIASESIHRRRDGSDFPVWVHASYYQDHELELSFACCRDLTEKRATELALRTANDELERRVLQRTAELAASEARYQELYHNAPDMFASIDAASGAIVQCNRTLTRYTGYSMEELVGRPVGQLFDAACKERSSEAWSAFQVNGEVGGCELRLRCKDGRTIDVSVNISAVRDSHGRIIQRQSTFRDISAYRQAERQIEHHRSELAHVARLATTGEMAAGLAHELNQPLYALNNFAQGTLRRLEAGTIDREALAGVMRDIASESQRAAEIIRSLRRYVGKREQQRALVDVNESVRCVARLLNGEAERRQSTIQLQLGEQLPPVRCDSIQIEQVLMNLILNGLEAMSDTPAAERRIRIHSELTAQGQVRLAICDQGRGLPDGSAARIFDPFYTSKADGIGLGLTISRTIIESHGGELQAVPNEDRGATFSFDLPVFRGDL